MSDYGEANLSLFFFTVGEVHFAADVEQAAGMAPYSGECADDLFWFHEEFGFGKTVAYQTPVVVTIRTRDGRPYRIIIDQMEEIVEFRRDDLRLFPEILEPKVMQNGMWAVLPRHGKLVLLVDFQSLLQHSGLTVN